MTSPAGGPGEAGPADGESAGDGYHRPGGEVNGASQSSTHHGQSSRAQESSPQTDGTGHVGQANTRQDRPGDGGARQSSRVGDSQSRPETDGTSQASNADAGQDRLGDGWTDGAGQASTADAGPDRPGDGGDGPGRADAVQAGRRQSLAVLRHAGFRRLFLAQTVNLLGSAIAPIALAFAVLGQPGGSATHLGLILAARSLGQVAFLLFGGVLADRLPRLRLMTGSNLIAFAAQGSMAGLFLAGPAPLAAVATLAAVNGAAAALFLPAARGVVPQLIPADQLQPGNALLRLSRNSASIAGAALAGVLLAVAAPGWALACDAVSFLVSAALLARISIPAAVTTADHRDAPPSILTDLREGWREFRARAWVWLPVAQFTMVNGCFAAIWVLGPVVARRDLGGAPAWAAVLTANAVGLVGGSLLALRLRPRHPLRVACAATFGFLPPFFLLAAAAPVPLIAASMLVNGVCVDVFEVLWDTSLQRHVPPGLLSRITSYDLLGSFALGPLGLALAGPAAAAAGPAATLTGAGLLLAAASVVPLLSRAVRDLPAGPNGAADPPSAASPPGLAGPPGAAGTGVPPGTVGCAR